MDVKEQRRKKDRERYAHMTNEEKQEKMKKCREAYQRNKIIKDSTQLQKKKMHTWEKDTRLPVVKSNEKGRNMQPQKKS